ncbi:MAG: hypothetical protein M3R59_03515 [Verrucomicrobiota bacterium]|nr:hypothetical protein [Verrucomicrobiota bacterium]
MLAQILKRTTSLATIGFAVFLCSCATEKKQVALVSDPDAKKKESSLPWNQQQKWETEGQFANLPQNR